MYSTFQEYTPFDCIDDLIKYSIEKQDIEFWKSLPDVYIDVVMLDGTELKMRLKAEDNCIEKYGEPAYWFAFDNHEDASYKSEYDFSAHILKWKFADEKFK